MDEHKCKGLKELLMAERPALKAAFGHRRYLMSKRDGKKDPSEIDWGQAQQEFLERYGNAWMEGYKMAYCNYVCPYRVDCELKEMELNKWMRYSE